MTPPRRTTDSCRPSTPRSPAPDPVRLAELLTRAWLEVRTGRRPLTQLRPLVSPAAFRRLAAQLRRLPPNAAGDDPHVRRVVASSPSPGVCEATVLVEHRGRTTAIALRLERHLGAWRAVELTAPESGLQPLPTRSLPDGHVVLDAFDEVLAEAGERAQD